MEKKSRRDREHNAWSLITYEWKMERKSEKNKQNEWLDITQKPEQTLNIANGEGNYRKQTKGEKMN